MASKVATIQNYKERVNKVLHYIHTHLDEKLEIDSLAEIACFSSFHFHRIMRAHLNESLMAYIVRLRMESAANLILHTNLSITDIAYKMGYDVPSSFNKAFKKRFGIAPGDFNAMYMERIKVNYLETTKIVNKMKLEPKFKELKDKKVIYINSKGDYSGRGTEIAWEKVCAFAEKNKLFGWKTEFIGISHDDPNVTDAERLRYDACVTVTKEVKPEGDVGVKTIKGGRYAMFLHKGPYTNFQKTYDFIYGIWLPESKKELRDAPCFEKYLNTPEKTKPENLKTEIYIPLK
ncbi:MAG: AraC family transcriptional regulator [Bacteroidales bacterium]|nr:AraC family transcriptional regulator [Bacteroidales bacterium]MCF8404997.1 AraC family transcriptional regulator [Bacteroidales bacterium]